MLVPAAQYAAQPKAMIITCFMAQGPKFNSILS
jgi:hypothetical protein